MVTLFDDNKRKRQQPLITEYFDELRAKRERGSSQSSFWSSPPDLNQDKYVRAFRRSNAGFLGSVNAYKFENGFLYYTTTDYSEYRVLNVTPRTINGRYFEVANIERGVVDVSDVLATATIDDDSVLESIVVDKSCRNHGIGRNLIYFINCCCDENSKPLFRVYTGKGDEMSRFTLTQEGAGLIKSCRRTGILTARNIYQQEAPPSPKSDCDSSPCSFSSWSS